MEIKASHRTFNVIDKETYFLVTYRWGERTRLLKYNKTQKGVEYSPTKYFTETGISDELKEEIRIQLNNLS